MSSAFWDVMASSLAIIAAKSPDVAIVAVQLVVLLLVPDYTEVSRAVPDTRAGWGGPWTNAAALP